MSDGVLAAIIAASATVFAALLQLKASFAHAAARARAPNVRSKSRLPQLVIAAMLVGAGVCGFALSQWISDHRRAAQDLVTAELRARIEQMSRTEGRLTGAYNEIETSVLRNIGLQGVVVMASVPPCKPASIATPSPADSTAEASDPPTTPVVAASPGACTEAEASPVTLCATIPAAATVNDVELYVRAADAETPWIASRVTPGQEAGQARFADETSEIADDAAAKQVCERFVQWSTEHGRVARVVVRYSL
ncbi:MAG TPA: hypothetical protein VMV37_06735 [Gammaproteobacteria bacterium]|nr:hypothetical protein [Gammaproteobacteria bacterium]